MVKAKRDEDKADRKGRMPLNGVRLGVEERERPAVKSSRDAQGERITTGAPGEGCIAI